MKQHYDILIATPGTSMHNKYVESLMKTVDKLNKLGISWRWLNGASSLVHHAREVLMSGDGTMHPDDKGPLHGECSYGKMFWIDSDIVWEVEDFMRLYRSDKEIISGAYLLADGTTTTIHTKEYLAGVPKEIIKTMKEEVQVQSIGFGFVAIKCGVFERMERPWFAHMIQMIPNSRGEQLPDALGEDISFCVRAYKAGVPVYFDPKVLVTHLKTIPVRW